MQTVLEMEANSKTQQEDCCSNASALSCSAKDRPLPACSEEGEQVALILKEHSLPSEGSCTAPAAPAAPANPR